MREPTHKENAPMTVTPEEHDDIKSPGSSNVSLKENAPMAMTPEGHDDIKSSGSSNIS